MKQQDIRQQAKQVFPKIDKYSLNQLVQRLERGVAMGIIFSIAYIENVASAMVRHQKTDYESRLQGHKYSGSRTDARAEVAPVVSSQLNQWKGVQ